jgi:hypothetical protein
MIIIIIISFSMAVIVIDSSASMSIHVDEDAVEEHTLLLLFCDGWNDLRKQCHAITCVTC